MSSPFLEYITYKTTAVEINKCNCGQILYLTLATVTKSWLNYRTRDMMNPQNKQPERSQTGRIKYHILYPRYPVNQGPTINNN